MATVVECLWASEPCESCCKRDECRDERRVEKLRSEHDAARRAGKAEGLREAAEALTKEADERTQQAEVYKRQGYFAAENDAMTSALTCRQHATSLLARAEEVERHD